MSHSIHVLIFVTHLHPGDVSDPSRSLELHLNSIHVQSQNHPDLKMCVLTYIQALSHLHPGLKILASAPSMYFLYSIQAQKNANQLNPGPYQNSFWSQDVCFTSGNVLPHQLPGPKILVSSPSMYRLTTIQVQRFLSHLHPCTVPLPPG